MRQLGGSWSDGTRTAEDFIGVRESGSPRGGRLMSRGAQLWGTESLEARGGSGGYLSSPR